jgi:putative ABC transport system permease protein
MPRFLEVFRLAGREPSTRDDVENELQFHLAEMEDLLMAQGATRDVAREEARRRLGDIERLRKELRLMDEDTRRSVRRTQWIEDLWSDLRFAARGLARAPGFTLVVVATLGLAIGANATMFGVVDRLLLRPPAQVPYASEIRRVTVARWVGDKLTPPWDAVSYPSFTALRNDTRSFAAVAAVAVENMSSGSGAEARPIRAVLATGQYFPMLGTRPFMGRFFGEEDDREPSGSPVVVVSHAYWRQALGARPDVLGEIIRLDNSPYEVIGVAPAGFTGTDLQPVDMWIPFNAGGVQSYGADGDWRVNQGWQFINIHVRLKAGVNETAAATEAMNAYQAIQEPARTYEKRAVPMLGSLIAARTPGASEGSDAQVAAWLFGVAAIVLIIACANVANLVLARGVRREGEMAVRLAIGGSRWRLMRMLLTESILLAALGAGVGMLLSRWGGDVMRGVLLPGVSWDASGGEGRVLAITAIATIFAAIVASLLPMSRAGRTNLSRALHGASRQVGASSLRLRTGLLLVQTTLCTALLVGAGLFVRSLNRVSGLDLGIDASRLVSVRVDLGSAGVPVAEQQVFYRDAVERLRNAPGVRAAGAMQGMPFGSNSAEGVRIPGRDSIKVMPGGGPYFFRVSPGAMEAMGVRLIRGRLFTPADGPGTPAVAVISERMATDLWPGEEALGKCFQAGEDERCREIVGVVANLHRQELIEEPFLLYFTLLDQQVPIATPSNLLVATNGSPDLMIEPIRKELHTLRGDLPYVSVRAFEEIIAPQKRSWRLGATMFTVFAGLSLLIAAVGLYGVLSYLVSERTRELGLRAALGASPGTLLEMIVRSGLASALIGVVLGLGFVTVVAGKLGSLLYQTSPRDPLVLATAGGVVILVALAASVVPGLRATKVDPMEALRAE